MLSVFLFFMMLKQPLNPYDFKVYHEVNIKKYTCVQGVFYIDRNNQVRCDVSGFKPYFSDYHNKFNRILGYNFRLPSIGFIIY